MTETDEGSQPTNHTGQELVVLSGPDRQVREPAMEMLVGFCLVVLGTSCLKTSAGPWSPLRTKHSDRPLTYSSPCCSSQVGSRLVSLLIQESNEKKELGNNPVARMRDKKKELEF